MSARTATNRGGCASDAPTSVASGRSKHRGLQVTRFSCDALDGLEPHALGVTYWFDPPPEGGSYTVTVRLRGRRIGVKGRPGRRDTFEKVERIESVLPGTGPVAVTSRVSDVASGEWHVTATAEAVPSVGRSRAIKLPNGSSAGVTAYAPVVRISAPGARLGAWPALVGVGVVCALVVQYLLGRHAGLPTLRVLGLSLLSSLVGAVGAKAYYLVEHRRERPPLLTAGMCIQGFVLAAIATLVVVGALALDVAVGELLDVTTPGLLWAMTIGRFGCFFGGCCAGRPTPSRFGLWSSNRRLGLRRIPAQLLESALALVLGGAALTVVTADAASPPGLVFAAAIAAYTLGRQLLFPLRDLPRNTSNGRTVTLASPASCSSPPASPSPSRSARGQGPPISRSAYAHWFIHSTAQASGARTTRVGSSDGMPTNDAGTTLSCSNADCGCQLKIEKPCPHGDSYTCACGHPLESTT